MRQNVKAFILLAILAWPLLLLTACGEMTNTGYRRASAPPVPAEAPPSALESTTPKNIPAQSPEVSRVPGTENLPTVKIGILLPLSGQNRQLGESMLKAAQMALFETGFSNLELIPRDTQGTESGGRNAAQSAIDSGAQIILGPVFAPAVRGAKNATQRSRINMIAFSTDWTLAGDNTYIMGFLPFDQVERVTKFAASRGIKTAGILAPNTPYGDIVTSAFNKAAPASGMMITKSESYIPNAPNLTADVSAMAGGYTQTSTIVPFEAILMPASGQDARNIGTLLTEYGLPPSKVRRLGTGLFDEESLAREKNLEGAWFAAPSPGSRKSFEDRYVSTFGTIPPRLSTLAYDATALASVLARTGLQNNGRAAFDARAIENPNGFSGVDGIFRFRSDNTVERGLAILEFTRGRITVLDLPPQTFQSLSQ